MNESIKVSIGNPTSQLISPLLFGYNILYTYDTKDRWEDGWMAEKLKEVGATTLRYPGGHIASFWHWRKPYYPVNQDEWDPEVAAKYKEEDLKKDYAHYLDLDSFMEWNRIINGTVLLGANLVSGHRFGRVQDGIDEAVALLKYCKGKNYNIEYMTLDNEVGHRPPEEHVPSELYPQYVRMYSEALKAFDPNIKLICNYIHRLDSDQVKQLVRESGKYFDIYDHHWYYSNGKHGTFYQQNWLDDDLDWVRDQVKEFRAVCAETGNEHLKLGFHEWNISPCRNGDAVTQFDQAMVMADMLMLFIEQNAFSACVWPLYWPTETKPIEGADRPMLTRNLMDTKAHQINPPWHLMRMFRNTAGKKRMQTSSSNKNVVVLAAGGIANEEMDLFVLNKSNLSQVVAIDGIASNAAIEGRQYIRDEAVVAKFVPSKMQTTADSLQLILEPLSLNYLRVK